MRSIQNVITGLSTQRERQTDRQTDISLEYYLFFCTVRLLKHKHRHVLLSEGRCFYSLGVHVEVSLGKKLNPKLLLMCSTVCNHVDAVIMCSDWDHDAPNILESDKVKVFTLNYIFAISKLDAVWLCHSRGRRMFSGEKFTEVSVWRADRRGHFFFNTNTLWVKVFASDRCYFSCRSVTKSWQDRWEDRCFSTYSCSIFSLIEAVKDSYYITFVWSCKVTLWEVSLY